MKKSNSNINIYERTKMLLNKFASQENDYQKILNPTIMQQYLKQVPDNKQIKLRNVFHHNTFNNNIAINNNTKRESNYNYSYLTQKILSPKYNEDKHINQFIKKEISPLKKLSSFCNDNKKVLFLDLDETLVHSSFEIEDGKKTDFILNIPFERKYYKVYVNKRPFLDIFLHKLADLYELNIFTASIQTYADKVINAIDHDNLIKKRFYRQHCTLMKGQYVKDLTPYTDKSLKNVLILDNNPISYLFNPSNGIPISTWINDENDSELIKLLPILEKLAYVSDVRIKLGELISFDEDEFTQKNPKIKQAKIISRNERNNIFSKESSNKDKNLTFRYNGCNNKNYNFTFLSGNSFGKKLNQDENKNILNTSRTNFNIDNKLNKCINNKTITKYLSNNKQNNTSDDYKVNI